MLAACQKDGLGESFAAESGVFLGALFGFMKKNGDKLDPSILGALACVMPLKKLYEHERWKQVLEFGELLLAGLPEPKLADPVARDTVASARSAVLSNMINAARRLGRLGDALALSDVDLASASRGSDDQEHVKALTNRGLVLQELKRSREAEKCYREALMIVNDDEAKGRLSPETAELKRSLVISLESLKGERDEQLGPPPARADRPRSAGPLDEYPGLFVHRGSDAGELNHRGLIFLNEESFEEAISCFLQALEAATKSGDSPEIRGIIESNLAMCYEEFGDFENAVDAYGRAIDLHESDKTCWEPLGKDLFNLGILYEKRDDRSQAIECFKRAWDTVRENNDRTILSVSILRHLALMRFLEKDYARAKAALDRGLEIYERIRPDIADAEGAHAGPLNRYRSLLELYLHLAAREGWHEHGTALIERGKSRFWYESLFAIAPAAAKPPPAPWNSVADLIPKELSRDGVAVYTFMVGPNATFVSLSFEGHVELHSADISYVQLREHVARFRTEVEVGARFPGGFSSTGRAIAGALLPDAAYVLPRASLIVLMPDGPLWQLPFDALPVGGDGEDAIPLVSIAPTMLAPSYAVLRSLCDGSTPVLAESGNGILVISDPAFGPGVKPLPGTRIEAQRIFKALGHLTPIHLEGLRATPENVLPGLDSRHLIHLATHAVGDLENDSSLLYLSDGHNGTATISAADILTTRISAVLVFLSACSSSIGPESIGEGLMSLGRAFLRAGARSVVASLWSVEDMETSNLAGDFYARLARGRSVATALWETKKEQLRQGISSRTWAAFQAHGDGEVCPLPIKNRIG